MKQLEDIFIELIHATGEDVNRPSLFETPRRAAEAWRYWMRGYSINPDELLKTFENDNDYDAMVIVHGIDVHSYCEHHLAPIIGTAHVGYVPSGKIVGLSKLARVVEAYAARLQVQERITMQVADCLSRNLEPLGVGVLIRAEHGCMSSRGVKLHQSVTTTSAMLGCFRDEPSARAEFLQLCLAAEKTK
jgi:GTP cyclohydrolase I